MRKLNQSLDTCVKLTGLGPVYAKAIQDLQRDFQFGEWKNEKLLNEQQSIETGGMKVWLTDKFLKRDG